MSFLDMIIAFIITFIITIIITPLIIKASKKFGVVDRPNDRKKHNGEIPLLGGLALILPITIGLIWLQPEHPQLFAISLGALLIITIGVVDDLYSVKPVVKLFAQITASIMVIAAGLKIEFLTIPFMGSVDLGVWSYIITVLWIVGITNAINLIDGLDGLAGGVSAIAFLSMFVMAITDGVTIVIILSILFIAALSGFLIYNFYPAKIFLGDTGSLFIGYSIAVVSMLGLFKNVTLFSFIIPIVMLLIPICDTIFAIIRRAINKQHIMTADRKHIHYVLLEMGFSHRATVLMMYAFSAFFGAMAIIFTNATMILSLFIMAFVILALHLLAELTGVVQGGRTPVLNQLKRLLNPK
ncbi:undecaprenyl-phosphate alpha-N-acetylglucosaminyl 1-phosphate transferase [Halalkalibacillus sediminis]|uniref:Undecaprenyl-phosphate alpha-N-acetylglucosaminyl 1-phosphate transferase n=1 Tax=Halalkalibacillus sediminis TaxID=2018042 RepID=A0A2I0QTW3_9BACI|nr:MraY family glycosyltransferase [Halalkalibacillus sediminis]PKR77792.1 undecaprenyl-phosphate alpha-N-acetylglucosaminyl 1-phosphate transferase [Halalkalibacillus sediminis]